MTTVATPKSESELYNSVNGNGVITAGCFIQSYPTCVSAGNNYRPHIGYVIETQTYRRGTRPSLKIVWLKGEGVCSCIKPNSIPGRIEGDPTDDQINFAQEYCRINNFSFTEGWKDQVTVSAAA